MRMDSTNWTIFSLSREVWSRIRIPSFMEAASSGMTFHGGAEPVTGLRDNSFVFSSGDGNHHVLLPRYIGLVAAMGGISYFLMTFILELGSTIPFLQRSSGEDAFRSELRDPAGFRV